MNPTPEPQSHGFLNAKKNLRALLRFAVIVCILFAVIFLALRLSNHPSQAADVAGSITRKLVPWNERAEEVFKKLMESSGTNITATIQRVCHPTGSHPELDSYDVRRVGEDLSVRF